MFVQKSALPNAKDALAVSHLLGDVYLTKPKSLCNGATYGSFAIQNHIEFRTIKAIALRKGDLTSLAFNCGSQQMNNVIIIKHAEIVPFRRRIQSDVVGTLPMSGHVNLLSAFSR
jgi:hypothetical protein